MATLVFEHTELVGSDRLGETLRDHGHRLDVRRLHRGDAVPTDLDGIDAIVTCGGGCAPDDDACAWLEPEMELLRLADAHAMPVVGFCLGSQILAQALGGEVALLDGGIEAGWHEIALTPVGREDPLHAGLPWTSMQPSWHRYHVTKTPPGARVLAKSERTPVQAWALGLRTYGFQYHPEIHAARLDEWARDKPGDVTEAGLTLDALAEETASRFPAFARTSQRLFDTIALVLMPLDRRYAGVAKDLHH